MLSYVVCEVSGKQYRVEPNKPFEVDYLGEDVKQLEAKVLLLSEDGKVAVGAPFLKDSVKLDFLETVKSEKVRVAKFHAKANYRRATGHRAKMSKVVLSVKN